MEDNKRTLNLPVSGKTAVIKNWITAKEKRSLLGSYAGRAEKDTVDMNLVEEYEKALIGFVVLSLDEDEKNLYEKAIELPSGDYELLIEEVNKSVGLGDEEKKV